MVHLYIPRLNQVTAVRITGQYQPPTAAFQATFSSIRPSMVSANVHQIAVKLSSYGVADRLDWQRSIHLRVGLDAPQAAHF
jgi:hypothetical protein